MFHKALFVISCVSKCPSVSKSSSDTYDVQAWGGDGSYISKSFITI